ncbi:NADH-quinone oxidoreductase subunit M [Candidatus Hakubella thermalkaliphila]|uniref:NADH-quinone oxidoreductase subunit M n=1 Tax=Candidatus Hakubella thermalkaliphila TaxID=2754717 RepID=A0A6V8PWZ3_9ACTN|nr:NADH-quinone oxidoreductase subunit M [Candidatus Hakubella thermalkaliphila]GFP37065.1 NADH-quinone oxidoreductase subunit M [Candidatus Hakubella thermalkaliphila]
MGFDILSLILFLPLAGSILVLLIPKENKNLIKGASLVFSLPSLVLSGLLYYYFDHSLGAMQFQVNVPWVRSVGLFYQLGVDGISLPLVILTALLSTVSLLASWTINEKVKGYFSLMLLLETGMLGVFLALDFILFFIFWELVLLPMYFIIGLWGGPRRDYASTKFFLYTLLGSVLLLVGILLLYFSSGLKTFDMVRLINAPLPAAIENLVYLLTFVGFAVKVPIWPFHSWLPDAHVEAPTAGSVLLAGILLKMGTYGFVRVSIPILPGASRYFATALAILAVISIIYGAFCAMAQKDIKTLVAYSSVSHMGYVMLGVASLAPQAVNGAVLQMVSHGLITGMLFLLVGMIYERTHTRMIPELGGLSTRMPVIAGILAFTSFASLGLPGLSGFWAEFLVLLGTFSVGLAFYKTMAVLAALGIVITAGYFLWMLQRVILQTYHGPAIELPRISFRELVYLAPLIMLIILIGIYPGIALEMINSTVLAILG